MDEAIKMPTVLLAPVPHLKSTESTGEFLLAVQYLYIALV